MRHLFPKGNFPCFFFVRHSVFGNIYIRKGRLSLTEPDHLSVKLSSFKVSPLKKLDFHRLKWLQSCQNVFTAFLFILLILLNIYSLRSQLKHLLQTSVTFLLTTMTANIIGNRTVLLITSH